MNFTSSVVQTSATRLAVIILGLGNSILLARWLGPEGSGIFALLWIAPGLASRFGNLGIGSSLAYFTARKQITLSQARFLLFGSTMLCTLIVIPTLLLIRSQSISPWRDIEPSLFYLILCVIPLQFAGNFYQRFLSGLLLISRMNIANIVMSISTLLGTVIFVVYFNMNLWGACLTSILAQVCFILVQRLSSNRHEGNQQESVENRILSVRSIPKMASKFIGYGFWNYLIMMGNFISAEIPIYALKMITGNNWAVGIFSRAQGLGLHTLTVVEPISSNLFPFTASSPEIVAIERTNRLCRMTTLLLGIAAIILCIVSQPLIVLLYGEAFAPAANVLIALAPGLFMRPVGYFTIIHLAASGKHRRAVWPNVVAISAGIISGLLLIPKWGAAGAGLTVSVIIALQAACSIIEYSFQTGANILDILLVRRSDIKVLLAGVAGVFQRLKLLGRTKMA